MYLPTIESKNETKQTRRTETDHGYRERFDGWQMGEECGGMDEGIRGLRSTNK